MRSRVYTIYNEFNLVNQDTFNNFLINYNEVNY